MASRLFQAIVGVGIAMGGASACVVEHIVEPPEPDMNGGDDASTTPVVTADASVTVEDVHVTQDVTVLPFDGALDGDALIDAYCDAPWPTTKGNVAPLPGCIDPLNECADAAAFPCAQGANAYTCEHPEQASRCVGGQWQCPAGTRPSTQCICWSPVPVGFECTDAGLQLADAGN